MHHASAKHVDVACLYLPEADALLLTISDDGVGFSKSIGNCAVGKGLQGMRQRAAPLGADLEIATRPEGAEPPFDC